MAKVSLPLEGVMDQKIEPNFNHGTVEYLSVSSREKVVDQLMAELGVEMKSLDPDWERIQRVMGGLLRLKKTEELVERLKAEVRTPDVKWEALRELMAQLWSIKKEIVVGLLPALLRS